MFGCLLLSSVALLNAAEQPSNYMQVLWDTPTHEPAANMKEQPIIGGGMPIGNVCYETRRASVRAVPVVLPFCMLVHVPIEVQHLPPFSSPPFHTMKGETTALVFPLVHAAPMPAPPSPPDPNRKPTCRPGPLLDSKYCSLGNYIGCHDQSCQVKGAPVACTTSTTKEECAAEVAEQCAKIPACVAFSVLNAKPTGHAGWWAQMFRATPTIWSNFPDDDWVRSVSCVPCTVSRQASCGMKPLSLTRAINSIEMPRWQ